MAEYKGYCVKCKKKDVTMKNAKETTMKGKVTMRAVKGECPKCGTTMYKILGKK